MAFLALWGAGLFLSSVVFSAMVELWRRVFKERPKVDKRLVDGIVEHWADMFTDILIKEEEENGEPVDEESKNHLRTIMLIHGRKVIEMYMEHVHHAKQVEFRK